MGTLELALKPLIWPLAASPRAWTQGFLISSTDRAEVRRHLEPVSVVADLEAVVVPSLRRVLPAGRQGARPQPPGDAVLWSTKHQRREGEARLDADVRQLVRLLWLLLFNWPLCKSSRKLIPEFVWGNRFTTQNLFSMMAGLSPKLSFISISGKANLACSKRLVISPTGMRDLFRKLNRPHLQFFPLCNRYPYLHCFMV